MLLAAALVTALALLLRVGTDDRVAFRFLPGWSMPPVCMSHCLFGVDCPGCGLTRSFVHFLPTAIGSGRWPCIAWAGFWRLQCSLVSYRLTALLGPCPLPLGRRIPQLFGVLLIVCLIGNWLLLH